MLVPRAPATLPDLKPFTCAEAEPHEARCPRPFPHPVPCLERGRKEEAITGPLDRVYMPRLPANYGFSVSGWSLKKTANATATGTNSTKRTPVCIFNPVPIICDSLKSLRFRWQLDSQSQ